MPRASTFLLAFCIAGFVFLYAPILSLVIFSFNESKLVTVWGGFSTKWYRALIEDPQILGAAWISLKVAVVTATLSVVLGTLAAYVLTRFARFRGRALLTGMSAAPLVMPDVITGLSLLLLFVSMEQLIGWPAGRGMTTIIIAHVTFCMAYVTVVVQSRLSDMDESLEEAAMDLGAKPVRVFFDVTIPVIAPALIAGWLLAFTLSLDDLVVASFVTGPGASTLPMVIFSKVRLGVSPDINALATIIIAVVALGVLFASWQMRRAARMRARVDSGDQAFRAGGPREHWAEMTYGGALSFLRRRYTRELAGVDVAVMGFPYDAAVTYRPGCRLGPRAIRAASVQLAELKAFPWGFDLLASLAVVDRGDAMLDPHHPETVAPAIEAAAAEVIASGARLLALGGDHFIAWPLMRAHAARHGPLALVQVDAHGDLWPDDPGRIDHGTMMGRAIREGVVDAGRSTQVGVRTFHDSTEGLEVLTAPWVHRNGIAAALEVIRARAGEAPLYFSFDIDGLDPAFAPGTGTPVPGGLASWQALELVRGLGGLNLVGMDIVEVSPPFDHAEITALAAAHLAHDWLCVLAGQAGAVPAPVGLL